MATDKFREQSEYINVRWMQTFLYVAMHLDSEDMTQERIANALGLTQNLLSRIITGLSDRVVNGEPGIGLLKYTRDPTNEARKVIELTPKGRKLLADLQLIMKG
jgi:DNA-binding MarR family transcriptional regulator